jgi:hypothetical protein
VRLKNQQVADSKEVRKVFRIPSPASNCANFVGFAGRISGLECGEVTLVRRCGA